MSDIAAIDKNFKVETKIDKDDLRLINVEEEPFSIYGVVKKNGKYRRMPEEVAAKVSQSVNVLHTQTAGGRVRFVTDSEYIAVCIFTDSIGRMPHFALTGSAGVDVYTDGVYLRTFIPPYDFEGRYEGVLEIGEKKLREITVNMPTYSEVTDMYIGISDSAVLKPCEKYKLEAPVVYYGSSITQGGCVSRPGMTYEEILSRKIGINYINLGFSGSAKGEREMAEYIASLEMSAFVYDYDFNAPTAEHLKNTHESFFNIIREKHPDLPIIIMSKPRFNLTEIDKVMRDIIITTYNNAVSRGDKNVYFIDGKTLMDERIRENGTVDGTHPTDLGFFSMAEKIEPVLRECLGL